MIQPTTAPSAMPEAQLSQPTLTLAAFARNRRGVTTTEKASAQSHLIDLRRMPLPKVDFARR